jgi:quinol monooxygenase YgiN
MTDVVAIASFLARPGREAEAEKFLWDLLTPVHDHPGCVLYALHRGADDQRSLALIGLWRSRDQLEQHLETPLMRDSAARVSELFTERPQMTLYWPVPGGASEKGSLSGALHERK